MIARQLALPCLLLGGLVASSLFPTPAQAQIASEYEEIRDEGLIFANVCEYEGADTQCACKTSGKCSITQLLQVVVNVSYLIFALAGTAAFAAFVYGGLQWVLAAGNADGIKRGRDAIAGALVGLVIIFGSYVAINLLISILKTGTPATGTIEDTIGDDADNLIDTESQ